MKVRLSLDAADDLRGIRSYITTHGDGGIADGVLARIAAVLTNLALFPHIGHEGHEHGTFELLVPRVPFLIVYRIDFTDTDRELIVLRVFHTARDRT